MDEKAAADEPAAAEVPAVAVAPEAAADEPAPGAPAVPVDEEAGADEGGAAPTVDEAAADEPAAVQAPTVPVDEEGAAAEGAAPAVDEEAAADKPATEALAVPVAAGAAADEPAPEAPAVPVDEEGPAPGEPPAQAPAAAVEEEGPAEGGVLPVEAEAVGTAAEAEATAAEGALALAHGPALDPQHKERRRLLFGLGGLVLLLILVGAIFGWYLWRPGPLPELLPLPVDVNYRPHYLFSMYGIEKPAGVAVSPDGERIYVTEAGGQREVKILDRDGNLLGSLAPPHTAPAQRAPVYVAVDPGGRVFVSDRLQRTVFMYGPDGTLLDAMLGPDLTLTEYLAERVEDVQPGGVLAYNRFDGTVVYQEAGEGEQVMPAPDAAGWAPLGVRVDGQGTMLLTNVAEGQHVVQQFPGDPMPAATWQEFDPPGLVLGTQGQGSEQLLFPNSAVADSQGRIYVTDGNNGRISVWDGLGTFLFTFGRGVGEGALSLPRGAAMDRRDRLHVVDAVQQGVKVYDVSGEEPRFLFAFGDWGTEDGQFNYPGDIALDSTGRLYIADRENDRIQVWSY
ncbi:MAG TPA: hypothetical protein VLC52_10115 [Anaerolineae bacterium]|nr:hypothetical protein [Anaerolineae bacterium]